MSQKCCSQAVRCAKMRHVGPLHTLSGEVKNAVSLRWRHSSHIKLSRTWEKSYPRSSLQGDGCGDLGLTLTSLLRWSLRSLSDQWVTWAICCHSHHSTTTSNTHECRHCLWWGLESTYQGQIAVSRRHSVYRLHYAHYSCVCLSNVPNETIRLSNTIRE